MTTPEHGDEDTGDENVELPPEDPGFATPPLEGRGTSEPPVDN